MPQKKKEYSKDWYGKKGLSWHVSCIFHKQDGELVKTTFVTPVDTTANRVERTLLIVLSAPCSTSQRCIRQSEVHFNQKCILKNYNAGNYHCVTVVVGFALLLNALLY